MTISTTTSRADYTGNGATLVFTVPFYFLDSADLKVVRTVIATGVETVLTLGADYTVAGAGSPLGGSITLAAAPAATQRLSIVRSTPYTQVIDYVENDPFPAATHERALDKLTMECQQLLDKTTRTFLLPDGDPVGLSLTLPAQAQRANKYLGFDNNGNLIPAAAAFDAAAMLAYFNSLPTTLPAQAGILWNNGGVLCIS